MKLDRTFRRLHGCWMCMNLLSDFLDKQNPWGVCRGVVAVDGSEILIFGSCYDKYAGIYRVIYYTYQLGQDCF